MYNPNNDVPETPETPVTARAKLKWHCRRGMRELDLLLGCFLESRYDTLTDADKALFSQFLEEPNEHLVDWLMEGREPPDGGYGDLVRRIRAY